LVLASDAAPREGGVAAVAAVDEASAQLNLVGESPAFRDVVRAARRMAACGATVLIQGETGTGKELFARALHYLSPRAKGPFIPVNCGAIPDALIEAELFGHARGAFTDAKEARQGLIAQARGGTLFLDELETTSPHAQVALLRFLQDQEYRPVGGAGVRVADVRVIGSTNADLGALAVCGEFRKDLLFRLNVLALELPPLRARGDDVIRLADHFLAKFAGQYGVPEPRLSPDARRMLRAHSWPGNVRELRNVVERTLLLSPPGQFALESLAAPAPQTPAAGGLAFPATLAEVQRSAVQAMLVITGGNRSEAARRLGVSRSRLLRLLRGAGDEEAEQPGE
jgi:DNA-binding NtrC family response regulator